VLVVVPVVPGVPVPIVQVVMVVVMGDGTVAALVPVNVDVVGQVMRPVRIVDHGHSLLPDADADADADAVW
jgi:hypothetical protein